MIQCSLRDITERKRREEKLRETATFLEKLITNANVPIVVWDSQFRITHFNHAFESLTGRTAGDVLRQTLDALFPSDRKQFTLENIQNKLISEQLRSVEVEIQPVKGPIRTLLWNAAPIFEKDDKTLLAVIAQGIDITEQRQAKEAMRVELQEKEVLLREIHHRVKNNMQVISSLFHLQAKNTMSDACRAILKEAQTRIQAMSLVHEKLYKSGHLSRIDFGEYINSLAIHLFQVYGVKPDLIRLETEFEDVNLDIASALPCGLLLNELISNALKHAFPGNRAGVVRIALKRGTGDLIKVLVADDGIGFPEDLDFSKAESFGLQIVNLLVGQLDGRIELDRTKGAAFTVTFCELKYPPPV